MKEAVVIKKNDIVRLTVTDVTLEGDGVGRHEGMAVFVPGCAVGDEIECRIVKVLKNRAYGKPEKTIAYSPDRKDRGCGVKKTCGGCVFRNISYEAELKLKQAAVKNAFVRMGGFEISEGADYADCAVCANMLPILGCRFTDRYRNKAQYPVAADKSGKAVCGFYAKRSHRIVPCGDCLLQPKIFGEITSEILRFANEENIPPYNEETGDGFLRHIYLRRGYHSREIMVCLAVRNEDKKYTEILRRSGEILPKKFPSIKSILLNINPEKTNVILGKKYVTLWGENFITDEMCDNKIEISPAAFYQVNTAQAERLYETAAELAEIKGNEDILDLYCGTGTIGLYLAKKGGASCHVTGAEIIPEAVENARKNAAENGISNIAFICADAGEAAKILAEEGRTPDVIITDPPRKGCGALTLESIVKMHPRRVVMVSCNPATAARDCRYLADNGYRLDRLRAVDMFPGAGHVECAVLMTASHSQKNIRRIY